MSGISGRSVLPLCAALLSAALLCGCGNTRTPVPSLTQPAAPDGFAPLTLPRGGVRISVPRDWTVAPGHGDLLATISSGTALVAVWRFPTTATTPQTPSALRQALVNLVAKARSRDRRLTIIRAVAIQFHGRPAVSLNVLAHINGRLRRIRSTHVFAPGGELVLDEYAPPRQFHTVDHSVFSPILHSLALSQATLEPMTRPALRAASA